jgi:hypothetical protein
MLSLARTVIRRLTALLVLYPALAFGQATSIYITTDGNPAGNCTTNIQTPAFFNNPGNWGSGAGQIGPGTTVLICGTISTALILQGGGASGNPLTIRFDSGAVLSSGTWTGSEASQEGAIQAVNVNNIVLDGGTNGIIQATNSGSALSQVGSTGITLYGSSNAEVKNFTINNMYVRTLLTDFNASGTGIAINGGSNISVHNNSIQQAQTGISFIFSGGTTTNNIQTYNNTIADVNWGIGGGDGEPNAIVNNVQIYNNDISDFYMWDSSPTSADVYHHDGIYPYIEQTGSQMTGLQIYDNYLHGNMGVNNTAFIFVSGLTNTSIINTSIYNNLIVNSGGGIDNGLIAATGNIFNNTLLGNGSICIDTGAGSNVQNNIAYGCGIGIAVHLIDPSTHIDYNDYSLNGGLPQMVVFDASGTPSFWGPLYLWQSNFGYDIHASTMDPLFVNPNSDYRLQSNSPVIGAGANLRNLGIPGLDVSAPQTFGAGGTCGTGCLARPTISAWDIGAYAYAAAVPINETTPGLNAALVYPDPVTPPYSPTIRICPGGSTSGGADIGVTIFDVSGRAVNSSNAFNFIGIPTQGVGANQFACYEYTWTGHKASGVYFAVVHAKVSGTTVKARLKFAVVK